MVTMWYSYLVLSTLFWKVPYWLFLSISTNLTSTLLKICSFKKRRNTCVTPWTILCPVYKVNKLSFCKVFIWWVLHMVVFYCRKLISNPFQKVKLINNRINTFVKVKTILCPGYEVRKTCLCNEFHQWVLHMFVFTA